jgi:rhodanese-related sulfurtransferase
MACLMLDQMGFTNTYNVVGGILEWQEKFGTSQ